MTKQQYIEYLICTPGGNYTCTNLANHLDGEPGTSHDAISDFLRRDKLTPRSLPVGSGPTPASRRPRQLPYCR